MLPTHDQHAVDPFMIDLSDPSADLTAALGGAVAVDPGVPADKELLAKNLVALGQRQPDLARAIMHAEARTDVAFAATEEGGALCAESGGKALASRRRPITEAKRIAQKIDIDANGGLLVLGLGVGHHVAQIVERADKACATVVFEPDLGLMRCVLERVDHTSWLGRNEVVIVTDPADVGGLTMTIKGLEALLSVGISIVEHGPSSSRLKESADQMLQSLTQAVGAMRMHVITAMMQADVTARNELMNLGHYIERPGIAELAGAYAGSPAVLVAAGPSLKRNIELLADPRVRERCVIIAVQTVLKPLLEAGIRPHFVTAIDYHEISKRFYEGLTPADVEGVTLIAEPKANAAILDAFPGDIRLPSSKYLDQLLGTDEDRGSLTPGATVAHLSYYLARYLGCDPVILVGQDLAFTDGQYYGAGAAIHSVWGPELNPFNSLEMLEWQRIVRNRGHLHKAEDHLGRPVYTDDQMAAYLAQFERDFGPDVAGGKRVIDATEGGVRKQHTDPMLLAEAIDSVIARAPKLAPVPPAPAANDSARRRATADLVRKVRRQVKAVGRKAIECSEIMQELKEHQRDRARNRALVDKTHKLRSEVEALEPGYGMLMKLNQLGGFQRFKADRAIALASHESELAEQRARIDRDTVNLRWVGEYADVFEDLLRVCERALQGGEKRTRDVTPRDPDAEAQAEPAAVCVAAFVRFENGRDTEAQLRATLLRLGKSKRIESAVVIADDPDELEHKLGTSLHGLALSFAKASVGAQQSRAAIRAGRAWAGDSWRGGLAGLSVFDEVLDPEQSARVCAERGFDAAICVGASWIGVDAELADELIARFEESPKAHPVVFSQAPPGLCGALVCAAALDEMAEGRSMARGSMFATFGGILGYFPLAPRHDPIARPGCIQIDAEIRSAAWRYCAGEADGLIEHALSEVGEEAGAGQIASWFAAEGAIAWPAAPRELVIDIAGADYAGLADDLTAFAALSPGGLLSIEGERDPLSSELLEQVAARAQELGLIVHVRTGLTGGTADADRLLGLCPQVVSVDCVANGPEVYRALTGRDDFASVEAGVQRLIEGREMSAGFPSMWVVPRITRCDAVYEQIEHFYDRWLVVAGAAVIDPMPVADASQRIEPLPLPKEARERLVRRRMVRSADGSFALALPSGGALACSRADLGGAWAELGRSWTERRA